MRLVRGRPVLCLLALLGAAAGGGPAPADGGDDRRAAEAFFGALPVADLRLTLAPEAAERLRREPRAYVPAGLAEGPAGTVRAVALKLKGAAGSFRPLDDRPAMTVDVNASAPGQRFHGLVKLHLNNSVQDESLLCEALAADLFARAGLPAPRVGWARVRLNDRDLGLYVLKEGVDRRFLARHFADASGNLYDGGFCQDVDAPLERDAGRGPDEHRDLAALAAAGREPDLERRAEALARVLDLDRFLTFVALERLLGHWDGYAGNRNNYRVYFDPGTGRAHFLPQGLDQLFGDPGAALLEGGLGLLYVGALEVPALRARYRERLRDLLPLLDRRTGLWPALERRALAVAPGVRALGPEAARVHGERLADLRRRMAERAQALPDLVERPEPEQPVFDGDRPVHVAGWEPRVAEGEPLLEEGAHAGRPALGIACAGKAACVASWRRRLALPRGRYALSAELAVEGVAPRPEAGGAGAGLRISGSPRPPGATGTAPWSAVTFPFEVVEGLRSVELVAELRAASGRAWFDAGSLRLRRLGP